MDFELNEEQRMMRDTVRKFAQDQVKPLAQRTDETGEFPAGIFREMGELGLLGLPVPERYGGVGADTVSYAIAVEELSAACGSTGLSYAAHTSLACMPLLWFGNEAQKTQYLVHLASGQGLGAFGLTEPQSGSDAAGLLTTAVRDGDDWVINGQKMWITSGALADVVLVAAVTDPARGARVSPTSSSRRARRASRPARMSPRWDSRVRSPASFFLMGVGCRKPICWVRSTMASSSL